MTKQDFISTLERTLRGAGISESIIWDNINYYSSYFSEQMSQGRSEQDIAEELGDPRLIAKTIIGIQEEDVYEDVSGSYDSSTGAYEEETAGNPKGFHAQLNENGWDVRVGRFKINSWYGYLLIILIIYLILKVVGSIFSLLAPVLVPVIIILLVIQIFKGRR